MSTPNRKMKDLPGRYENGSITLWECFELACKWASEEEVCAFIAACSTALKAELQNIVSDYGDDESTWPITHRIAMYGRKMTAKEIHARIELEQQQIWNGVRILKPHLQK